MKNYLNILISVFCQEIVIVSIMAGIFLSLPIDIKHVFKGKRPDNLSTYQEKSQYKKSYEHFSHETKRVSNEFEVPPPKLNLIKDKRGSFYSMPKETIGFDIDDVYSIHSEFVFLHEMAHHLQTHKKINDVDLTFLFLTLVFIYICLSFFLSFKVDIIKSTPIRLLYIVLAFSVMNKGIMVKEFHADSWAYSNLKNPAQHNLYHNFFNGEERGKSWYKKKFKILSWFLIDHPDVITRKNISKYKNPSSFQILIIDFNNHYGKSDSVYTFKKSKGD